MESSRNVPIIVRYATQQRFAPSAHLAIICVLTHSAIPPAISGTLPTAYPALAFGAPMIAWPAFSMDIVLTVTSLVMPGPLVLQPTDAYLRLKIMKATYR
jgi:predicted benzoate:H+ symporter BenE